jgi:hypothetical protein
MEIKIDSWGKFTSRSFAVAYSNGTAKTTVVAFGIDGYWHVLTGRQLAYALKNELVKIV